MELLLALGIIFALQIVFFVIASFLKTDKLTDLAYGLTFVIVALWAAILSQDVFVWIIALAITLWGLRLAGYLLVRIMHMGKDVRFDGIREDFWRFASFWFFQAIIIFVVLIPFLFTSQNATYFNLLDTLSPLGWSIFLLGLLIWLIGFVLESTADIQKFIAKTKNPHRWVEKGVFKYSRHPNYFGEMLCWWGLLVAMIPVLLSWQAIISLLSPLAITAILLFGSGIPMLEEQHNRKYGQEKRYKEYKKRTNVLLPLPKAWFKK